MGETVVGVNRVTQKDNPASIAAKIDELLATKYPPPVWVRRGTGVAENTVTKDWVNLVNEATDMLFNEGARNDAVAVVENEDGQRRSIFIEQAAVKAAGNDFQVLKANLQKVLSTPEISEAVKSISPWVWVAGGAGVLFLLSRSGRRPGRR